LPGADGGNKRTTDQLIRGREPKVVRLSCFEKIASYVTVKPVILNKFFLC